MKEISVIGKEVQKIEKQPPCKLLVTDFDTNNKDLNLQPPPPFPEKRPKTIVAQRPKSLPNSFLDNIKVGVTLF